MSLADSHALSAKCSKRALADRGSQSSKAEACLLQVCGNSSWLIPLGLSLPYAWRFCQCLRVNRDTGNRSQLYNALKYSTAFPVVLFSYMNYHTDEASWVAFYRPLWVMSALLNSAYSYFWDVERDWEVQWFTAPAG